MAGKDFKVQKKAKEQQRLSVFQPAFRWGGNNNASSSGSSSKIEAKKTERPGINRNEKADQPRRNDNRIATREESEENMTRDAKRMTTFQPIFGSLFSSKPSKGKEPEPAQRTQAQKPLATGSSSQHVSKNQVADATRYGTINGASGSSRGGRSGPGYQNGGLRIDTQETLGINSRRNEAGSSSSGKNGRGGLAPISEGDSPRPRSPLQRNPAFAIPEDELKPLGISNAFGPGGRGKEKEKTVSNLPANSTVHVSSGNQRNTRSNGQDRGLGSSPSSGWVNTRDHSPLGKPKMSGVDTEYNPAVKRERTATGFQRDGEKLVRKPVVSDSEPQIDPRSHQQSSGRGRTDEKLAQQPIGRTPKVPQLVVTDTSDVLPNGASGRLERPSRAQKSIGATTSRINTGRGLDSEISDFVRPLGQQPSRSDGKVQPNSRSPLDRFLPTASSRATQEIRDVSQRNMQEDSRWIASSAQKLLQEDASKPSLSVFPRQEPQSRHSAAGPSKSTGLDPLRPTLGREEVDKLSKAKGKQIREVVDARDVDPSPGYIHPNATASRHTTHRSPFETFKPSSATYTPQSELSKATSKPSRESIARTKPHAFAEQWQATKESLAVHKPGPRDDATISDSPLSNRKAGRPVDSSPEEKVRPLEAEKYSSTTSSALKPEKHRAEQLSKVEAKKPEVSRTGWASRYIEGPKKDASNDKLPRDETKTASAKGPVSNTTSGLPTDQDSQRLEATRRNKAGGGASSFKQRMQEDLEDLGVEKESSLLKPLKSIFSGPKKEDTSQTSTQPRAGDSRVPHIDATMRPGNHSDSSASLVKPSKEWKPYTVAKTPVVPELKAEAVRGKAPIEVEWLPPKKSDTPSRPERPPSELFMGVSGSALRPDSLLNTAPLRNSQSSPSSDQDSKQKSAQGTNVPLSEVKTNRSDLLRTRKPVKATQPSRPEREFREHTAVVADMSARRGSDSSRIEKPEVSAVRVVSGIIDKPREIDIQKPLRLEKTTKVSDPETQPQRRVAERSKAIDHSHNPKKAEAKKLEPLLSQGTEPSQDTDLKERLHIRPVDRSTAQKLQFEESGPRKPATIGDEWPRPLLAPPAAAGNGVADHSRVIDGGKVFASESRSSKVSESPASLESDVSEKSGLLGRWAGRAKKDRTPEPTDQSLTTQPPPVTTKAENVRGPKPALGPQRCNTREDSEIDVSAGQSTQPTSKGMSIPSISVVGPSSEVVLGTDATQRSASSGMPSATTRKEVTSPPKLNSQSVAQRNANGAPPSFNVGGRKLIHQERSETERREGIGHYVPLTAEIQNSGEGRPTDRDMPKTSSVGDLNVTSPQLPSQEDFFKQIRQSVMFQNAGLADKTDLCESTDANTKRKSRRNRNVGISGLQPLRGVVVPDIPILDTSEYRSAVGGGDSTPYFDVPQTAAGSRPGQASLEKSQKHDVSSFRSANDLHRFSSRAMSEEEQRSDTRPVAPVIDGKPGPEHLDDSKTPSTKKDSYPSIWLDNSVSKQPSPSVLLPEAKSVHTDATETTRPRTASVENYSLTFPKNEPKIGAVPVMLAGHTNAYSIEQTAPQVPDIANKSRVPSAPHSAARDFEQSLAFDPSLSIALRGPGSDISTQEVKMTRGTEVGCISSHPVPSSVGIFRRPSFGDEEGLRQPIITHKVPTSANQGDSKVQSFFDGLFKSEKPEDFVLGLGRTSTNEETVAREGPSVGSLRSDPVEQLVPSRQSIDAGKESRNLNEVSSPPSMPLHLEAHGQNSELSKVDPHFPSGIVKPSTQAGKYVLSVRTAPVTARESLIDAVETSNESLDTLTSRSPEMIEPLANRKATNVLHDVSLVDNHDPASLATTRLEKPSNYDNFEQEPLVVPADENDRILSPIVPDSHPVRGLDTGMSKGEEIPTYVASIDVQSANAWSKIAPEASEYPPVLPNTSSNREMAPGSTETLLSHNKHLKAPLSSTDMSLPFAEGVSVPSMSQEEIFVSHSLSPQPPGEINQQLENFDTGESNTAPQTAREARGSFTSYFAGDERVPLPASVFLQNGNPDRDTGSSYAAYEPSSTKLVNESPFSSGQPGSMAGDSYDHLGNTDSTYTRSIKERDREGGSHQAGALADRSSVLLVHKDRREGLPSPSEADGNFNQTASSTSLDSPFRSRRRPLSTESHGSSWSQHGNAQDISNKSHMLHAYPFGGAGLTTSPQESDPDLSDHILSLYDGSEYAAPDHQSTGGFPNYTPSSFDGHGPSSIMDSAYTRSSREMHSPSVDHRDSMSCIEPMSVEASKAASRPSDACAASPYEYTTSNRSTSDPSTRSTASVTTPPREIFDPIKAEPESMEPAPLKNAGIKGRLLKLFSKSDRAEPGINSLSQATVNSPESPPISSPEPSRKTIRDDNDTTKGSPILSPDLPTSTESRLVSPSQDAFDGPGAGLYDPVILNEAGISTYMASSPSRDVSYEADLDQLDSASPVLMSRAGDTDLLQDRTPSEGDDLVYARSAAALNPDLSSPQAVHDNHSAQEALSPEPSAYFATPLDATEKAVDIKSQAQATSPELGYDVEYGASYASPCQPSEPVLSPRGESSSMGSPVQAVYSLEKATARGSVGRADDPTEAMSADSFPASPLLDEMQDNRSTGPEEVHEIDASRFLDADSSHTWTPRMESMEEVRISNDLICTSPESTTSFAETEHTAHPVIPEENETRDSSARVSGHELSRSTLEYDTYSSGDSPMPLKGKNWASGGVEETQNALGDSPLSDHMDDEFSRQSMPASAKAAKDSFSPLSPEGELWNDRSVQTGSFSPAASERHHDEDGATPPGDAGLDIDAPGGFTSNRNLPDGPFVAECDNVSENVENTVDEPVDEPVDEVFRVEDLQDAPHGSVHADASGSAPEYDEIREGGVDEFGVDENHPSDELQGSPGAFDGPRVNSHLTDGFLRHDADFDDVPIHAPDAHQGDVGEIGDAESGRYVEPSPSTDGGFEKSKIDGYPSDDSQTHPGAFDDAGVDRYPANDFSDDATGLNDTVHDDYSAGDHDDILGEPFDPIDNEPSLPSEQGHDLDYSSDDARGLDPSYDNVPYDEPALSHHEGEKDTNFGQEADRSGANDGSLDDCQQDSPIDDDHLRKDEFLGEEPVFDDQGDGVNVRESDHVDLVGEEEARIPEEGVDFDRGLGCGLEDLDGEPSSEAVVEKPANFIEGEFPHEDEHFVTDGDGNHIDEGRDLGGVEEYPMGGEAEEYFLGGGNDEHHHGAMEEEEPPMVGETENYLIDGEEGIPMDAMEEVDDSPLEGDDELPIDEMYGGDERSLVSMEEMESPMGFDEDLAMMDREEHPMDGEDEFPMEGEEIQASDRDIDDLEAHDQLGEDMSSHESVLDEEHGVQSEDGAVEERNFVDEELGSDFADEEEASSFGIPSGEELADYDLEDEELAPSEVDDREIQDASGERDEDHVEGESSMDDLDGADVPSIPASPTTTDCDPELASPTSGLAHNEVFLDDNSIFGEPLAEEEPAEFENADPIRLSALYMHDVGLLSFPPSPTVPQNIDAPEQSEVGEEEPREPVRFSALYRQSLDWSQALDSSMWEDVDDTLPEESEEQVSTAPVGQLVPESAKTGRHDDLGLLEVDQEPVTPVAASPLSPRPLETPPPDFDLDNHQSGDIEAHHLIDTPEELYKVVNNNDRPDYPVSPRLQPTPPPDLDRALARNENQDDRWDLRGPRTFDEMNLPRRVIPPPNTGDNQEGPAPESSSTQTLTPESRRSISQRFSGWWTGEGSSGQNRARPPPLPAPYDSRYGEPSSPA